MQRVEVSGTTIAFERAGEGPALVLLHGAMSDHREWGGVRMDGFDVIAWDAPGFGGSAPPPDGWGLEEYADCLAGLVAALGVGPPHVAGLSFGGGLAIEYARRHEAASLILLSAYAGWRGSLGQEEAERRLASVGGMEPWLAGLARSFARADLRPALARLDVPALVLAGALDDRAPPAVARDLARRLPCGRLEVIGGAGHELNTEAPDRVADAMRRFLRDQT